MEGGPLAGARLAGRCQFLFLHASGLLHQSLHELGYLCTWDGLFTPSVVGSMSVQTQPALF